MSAVRIAETLRHMSECIAETQRPHDDAEVRDAAERLGRTDYLPDPQEPLKFSEGEVQ